MDFELIITPQLPVYVFFLNAGIIDTPRERLFTYRPGENWATYYDPFFSPNYEPVFFHPVLEQVAVFLCGDNFFCLFDIATTEDIYIGLSTLLRCEEYREILELQIPSMTSHMCASLQLV